MVDHDKLRECLATLTRLNNEASELGEIPQDLREALMREAGRLSRPNRDELRQRNKGLGRHRRQKAQAEDRVLRAQTGIREARTEAVFQAPAALTSEALENRQQSSSDEELNSPQKCYVCKTEYRRLHHFYDSMCTDCGDLNYQKRFQTADLPNRVAVVTGARVKIGYHVALMLLRSGVNVIATTRFPVDASLRFSRESDFEQWKNRLSIHGLDLRHTPSVEIFANYLLQKYERLDFLINNAAQTVRRPPGFYTHLLPVEATAWEDLTPHQHQILASHRACLEQLSPDKVETSAAFKREQKAIPVSWQAQSPGVGLQASAQLSQIPYNHDHSLIADEVFPKGQMDADLQQIDLRQVNSWRLGVAEVSTPEMLEVHLVNAVAPFVLCSRLAPLMRKNPSGDRHIVNVSAMEGKFSRYTKTERHPHTNMAKAALNMLTQTTAKELIKDGIHMNAVDTGWVTDEDPAELSKRKTVNHDFQPPLDIVDGAARILDPIFNGFNTGHHWHGLFLKDYKPTDW